MPLNLKIQHFIVVSLKYEHALFIKKIHEPTILYNAGSRIAYSSPLGNNPI